MSDWLTCEECNGSGYTNIGLILNMCRNCNGIGFRQRRTLDENSNLDS